MRRRWCTWSESPDGWPITYRGVETLLGGGEEWTDLAAGETGLGDWEEDLWPWPRPLEAADHSSSRGGVCFGGGEPRTRRGEAERWTDLCLETRARDWEWRPPTCWTPASFILREAVLPLPAPAVSSLGSIAMMAMFRHLNLNLVSVIYFTRYSSFLSGNLTGAKRIQLQ